MQLDDVWKEAALLLRAKLALLPETQGHMPQIVGELLCFCFCKEQNQRTWR